MMAMSSNAIFGASAAVALVLTAAATATTTATPPTLALTTFHRMIFIIAEIVLCAFGVIGNASAASALLHPMVASGATIIFFGVAIVDMLICIFVPVVELTQLFSPAAYAEFQTETYGNGTLLFRRQPSLDSRGGAGGDVMETSSGGNFDGDDGLEWFGFVWVLETVWLSAVGLLIIFVCLERFFSIIAWICERDLVSRGSSMILGVGVILLSFILSGLVATPYFLKFYNYGRDSSTAFHLPNVIVSKYHPLLLPMVHYVVPCGAVILIWTLIAILLCIGGGCKKSSSPPGAARGHRNNHHHQHPSSPPSLTLGYTVHPDLMTIGCIISLLFLLTNSLGAVLTILINYVNPTTFTTEPNLSTFGLLMQCKTLLIVCNSAVKPLIYFLSSARIRLALADVCTCQCRRHIGYSSYLQHASANGGPRAGDNHYNAVNHCEQNGGGEGMELMSNHI